MEYLNRYVTDRLDELMKDMSGEGGIYEVDFIRVMLDCNIIEVWHEKYKQYCKRRGFDLLKEPKEIPFEEQVDIERRARSKFISECLVNEFIRRKDKNNESYGGFRCSRECDIRYKRLMIRLTKEISQSDDDMTGYLCYCLGYFDLYGIDYEESLRLKNKGNTEFDLLYQKMERIISAHLIPRRPRRKLEDFLD